MILPRSSRHKILGRMFTSEQVWRMKLMSYGLSKREADVAMKVADGLTNDEIADVLCVSVKTVQFHITNINAKFKSKARVKLLLRIQEILSQ